MKKLLNNKNLYDWIVWICIIAMMINVFFPFKGAFYIFALMVFAMARYNNLVDKEIERLMNECDKMDAEIKLIADPLLHPKNFQGLNYLEKSVELTHGKLTNNTNPHT